MILYLTFSIPLLILQQTRMTLCGHHVSETVDFDCHKKGHPYSLLALIFYVQVLVQTLYFAPLLACTQAPVKLLGFSFGLLYALYL